MAKAKTIFFCKECGFESAKWLGQCPGCKQWNVFTEEPIVTKSSSVKAKQAAQGKIQKPSRLSEVVTNEETRMTTKMDELNRVLGGGIVVGSLVLVGGDPGIGKSTLLLQMCKNMVENGRKILYISGEESLKQIKMRAERLGNFGGELLLLSETSLDIVEEQILVMKPEVVIIDSIQTMYKEEIGAAPGSVSQVRETTGTLLRLAKQNGISIFIVGHVTKEGMVAGPRVLEHMVDTVLYFEGDNSASYRILRAVKNRFGSTNEIGVFEMRQNGLAEVPNPSQYMLDGMPKGESGSAVSCAMEGTRPILLEVQALVCKTYFNLPRRTAAGTDYNRVNLLMAVIEKRLGIRLSECDAYVNVAGGMKINEPAIDLALVAVLISSYRNRAIDNETIIFGEVGLTGEVRAIQMAEQRVAEAERLGFKRCILPKVNKKSIDENNLTIKITGIQNIKELMEYI